MKKLFLTVLATVICMASGANAILNSDIEKQYEFQRVCEVCPYADQDMCRNWTPDCPDEEKSCLYNTLAACNAKCSAGTCKINTSGCYECYLTLKCNGSNQYLTETLCKNANTGVGTCKQDSSNNCWYFVAGLCPFETLMECSSSCSGTCRRTTINGCYMCTIDIGLTTGGDDSGSDDSDDTGTTADTNTVSGSCPTGTKKSADGCCCVPN